MREPRLQADGCLNFDDFTTLLKSLLEAVIGELTFIEAYSHGTEPEQIDPPIITYRVIKRTPLELKPRPREHPFVDEQDPNYSIFVWAQEFEYIIEFGFWAENNKKVEALMNDFETNIELYKGDIKRSGVREFLFAGQLEDNKSMTAKDKLANRTLRYMARLDRTTVHRAPRLNMVTVRTVDNELVFKVDK